MRKAKMDAATRRRAKRVVHTRAERLALRRKKRKEGPAALRRQAKRVDLQGKPKLPANTVFGTCEATGMVIGVQP